MPSLSPTPTPPPVPPAPDSVRDFARELARRSDRIVALILYSDLPWIDIVLEIQSMRDLVETEAPDLAETFERIYAARFQRIHEQWGGDVDPAK